MRRAQLPDRDLQRATEALLARARPNTPPQAADTHGLIQEFGGPGYQFTLQETAILVVTKPVLLVEWSLDSTFPGTARIGLSWSPWQIPRVWQDMVGSGAPPYLASTTNGNATDLSDWDGPFQLDRRDAIFISVLEAEDIEQLTLVLYMKELPVRTTPPVPLSNGELTSFKARRAVP